MLGTLTWSSLMKRREMYVKTWGQNVLWHANLETLGPFFFFFSTFYASHLFSKIQPTNGIFHIAALANLPPSSQRLYGSHLSFRSLDVRTYPDTWKLLNESQSYKIHVIWISGNFWQGIFNLIMLEKSASTHLNSLKSEDAEKNTGWRGVQWGTVH